MRIFKEADQEIVEEWKWETPVWSHNGLVCTVETYNSSLEGKVRRAIDIREHDEKPAFLAGGNPQIAKADGDAPVQVYITALPGWGRA